MAAALPFIAAGATLLQGVAGFSAGQYQAAVAKRNAQIATQNAGAASDAAQQRAYENDLESKDLLGRQLAAQSVSGLTGDSQHYLRRATQGASGRERQNIRLEGQAQSQQFLQEAANQRAAASNAWTQAWFTLGGSVLKAGSSFIGGSTGASNKVGARLGNGG